MSVRDLSTQRVPSLRLVRRLLGADFLARKSTASLTDQDSGTGKTFERERKFRCDGLADLCGLGYGLSIGLKSSFARSHKLGESFHQRCEIACAIEKVEKIAAERVIEFKPCVP